MKKSQTKKRIASLGLLATILGFSLGSQQTNADVKTYGVTLQTNVQEVLNLACDSATVNMGNLTPTNPITGSSVCTVTTNANGGYVLAVRRDDTAGTTMDKIGDPTTDITDRTIWDPTASAGLGNATVWGVGNTGLGFTVFASSATKNTSWWAGGSSVNDALNKYAGFSGTYTNIMVHAAYAGAATTTSIGYKLDVPGTQKSGAYDGSITYQGTSTP